MLVSNAHNFIGSLLYISQPCQPFQMKGYSGVSIWSQNNVLAISRNKTSHSSPPVVWWVYDTLHPHLQHASRFIFIPVMQTLQGGASLSRVTLQLFVSQEQKAEGAFQIRKLIILLHGRLFFHWVNLSCRLTLFQNPHLKNMHVTPLKFCFQLISIVNCIKTTPQHRCVPVACCCLL